MEPLKVLEGSRKLKPFKLPKNSLNNRLFKDVGNREGSKLTKSIM